MTCIDEEENGFDWIYPRQLEDVAAYELLAYDKGEDKYYAVLVDYEDYARDNTICPPRSQWTRDPTEALSILKGKNQALGEIMKFGSKMHDIFVEKYKEVYPDYHKRGFFYIKGEDWEKLYNLRREAALETLYGKEDA
jgi:hypothetical protein